MGVGALKNLTTPRLIFFIRVISCESKLLLLLDIPGATEGEALTEVEGTEGTEVEAVEGGKSEG